MTAKLSTILQKLDSVSKANRIILQSFCEYMQSKDHKSERHIVSILTLLISFDKFYPKTPFTSINKKRPSVKVVPLPPEPPMPLLPEVKVLPPVPEPPLLPTPGEPT